MKNSTENNTRQIVCVVGGWGDMGWYNRNFNVSPFPTQAQTRAPTELLAEHGQGWQGDGGLDNKG